jgi:hypothetical protein
MWRGSARWKLLASDRGDQLVERGGGAELAEDINLAIDTVSGFDAEFVVASS